MRGIKDSANGERTIEIRAVGGSFRQPADEHSAGVTGIEIVRRGRRDGDNVGSAGGTGDGYTE